VPGGISDEGQEGRRLPQDYHRFTHDFTIEAAKVMEKLNPGMTFCFLSGMGTDETQKSK
jgi:hypothetical protein